METENQQWFCGICCKNDKLKRKEKHRLTKVHKKNKERLDREEDYEEYLIRRDELLMENIRHMDLGGFVEKRKIVEEQLKNEFDRNYKVPE